MASGAPVDPDVNSVMPVSRVDNADQPRADADAAASGAGCSAAPRAAPSPMSPAQPSTCARSAASVSARVSPGSTTCLPACHAPNSAAANSAVSSR